MMTEWLRRKNHGGVMRFCLIRYQCQNYLKALSFSFVLPLSVLFLLSACTGLFDGIYDDADDNGPAPVPVVDTDSTKTVISGQLYIDATSWTDWYYVDLKAMADSAALGKTGSVTIASYPIPMTLTGKNDDKSGIYTYWYDVFGKGITVNEYRSFVATDVQQEPEHWTFAVHRNNVRTNGGAVYETSLTEIKELDLSHEDMKSLEFTSDVWTENVVWANQDQMLNCLIGSQGILANTVLSSWLKVDLPPIPPSFTLNNHVFILRLSDGTYAALQLANYQNAEGKKCHLSINYKYPI